MIDKEIQEKLENHEKRIGKNEDDITNLKINDSVQGVKVENLQSSIDKLTLVIEKVSDKFDSFKDGNSSKSIETWKVVLFTVAIPTIFFLLEYIVR